jgi:hypothetical protein
MAMCIEDTPVTHYEDFGLYVKHEELCCPGGPNFSKTRGVFAHIAKRRENEIGVLDTSHSQGGWAVARACHLLKKKCVLFYPVFKNQDNPIKDQQQAALDWGARLVPIAAGRSAILYNRVRNKVEYMMPNALKLKESVDETAAEVARTSLPLDINAVVISASSGTIAAGVIRGLEDAALAIIVHLGYSRPEPALRRYLDKMVGFNGAGSSVTIIDEGYCYADAAPDDVAAPPFPCDRYYDRKAWRWWLREGRGRYSKALLWNVG